MRLWQNPVCPKACAIAPEASVPAGSPNNKPHRACRSSNGTAVAYPDPYSNIQSDPLVYPQALLSLNLSAAKHTVRADSGQLKLSE
jgi:hypothetical protein